MKVVGIDLAGSPKNDTGFCRLTSDNDKKAVETFILHSNEEILNSINEYSPAIVAIDAPLIYERKKRGCDELLREYGALPVTLRGMEVLAERGSALASELSGMGVKTIEVHSTASAKILGVYNKKDMQFQKNILGLDLDGVVTTRLLSRDELDAIIAAITGFLYSEGATEDVGGDDGRVTIPKI